MLFLKLIIITTFPIPHPNQPAYPWVPKSETNLLKLLFYTPGRWRTSRCPSHLSTTGKAQKRHVLCLSSDSLACFTKLMRLSTTVSQQRYPNSWYFSHSLCNWLNPQSKPHPLWAVEEFSRFPLLYMPLPFPMPVCVEVWQKGLSKPSWEVSHHPVPPLHPRLWLRPAALWATDPGSPGFHSIPRN